MRHAIIVVVLCFLWFSSHAFQNHDFVESPLSSFVENSLREKLLEQGNSWFLEEKFSEAMEIRTQAFPLFGKNQILALRKMTLNYALSQNVNAFMPYIEWFLKTDFSNDVLLSGVVNPIQTPEEFESLEEKYPPGFSFWSFLYLYVALIGFYIAAILHFNKKVDSIAKILISSFVFIHSIFILHIFLMITRYQYQIPHTYRISTAFSFLYGPLLYLYFKRITQQYKLKKIDILHFIPTILFIIYLIPGYMLPADQKLEIMLTRSSVGREFSDIAIIILKLSSLLIYGHFIRKLYLASRNSQGVDHENRRWQKNIFLIHMSYVLCYLIYGFLLANNITFGFFFHLQVICMASMVMFIGYSANVQPDVFNGSLAFNKLFFKYEKSGLTKSLSLELKENLIHLFDDEKIYKDNNISLEILSRRLNTTRHNASQVINEHFQMSFHELINKHRIQEAKKILNQDYQRNMNIIDVAYEVGYNNKVTFNKAFKKETKLTPSEYQRFSFEKGVKVNST